MRYINAEKVLIFISRLTGTIPFFLIREVEDNGIDIVKCKSCKHWAYGKDLCTLHDMGMVADDYCSYGERNDKCKECWYWSEVHKRCENKCGCQFKPYGERGSE